MTNEEFSEFMDLAEVWADWNVKAEERERREALRAYLAPFTRPALPAQGAVGEVSPREARLRAAMERMDRDGPLPGMITAFEQQFGQAWTDRDWRQEASIWSAAWRAALNATPPAKPLAPDEAGLREAVREFETQCLRYANSAASYAQVVQARDRIFTATPPATAQKCDGNHGGPRCADPECWNDEAPPAAVPGSAARADAVLRGIGGAARPAPAEDAEPVAYRWNEPGIQAIHTVLCIQGNLQPYELACAIKDKLVERDLWAAAPPATAQDAEIDAAFMRGFKAARAQFTATPPATAQDNPEDDPPASEASEWAPPADYDGDGSVAGLARSAAQQPATAQDAGTVVVPDVSDLLTMAVEDGVIRLSQVMDADLQDALVTFVRRFAAPSPASAPAAEAVDPDTHRVQEEAGLLRAIAVMEDTVTAIEDWEDQELGRAIESSLVDLRAIVEKIRMQADPNYVPADVFSRANRRSLPAQGAGGEVAEAVATLRRRCFDGVQTYALNPVHRADDTTVWEDLPVGEYPLFLAATQARPSAVDVRDAGLRGLLDVWETNRQEALSSGTSDPWGPRAREDQAEAAGIDTCIKDLRKFLDAATPPAAQGEKGVG